MTPPSAFRYEYVGSGDDRKTITHANKNAVMNYPNREDAEAYDVDDYYEYVVDSPKKAFIAVKKELQSWFGWDNEYADNKDDLQYHVTEKELAERLANGEWVVVATWFSKNEREKNLEIYRDLWEIEDTISDKEEKQSLKRRKGYLGSYWGNVYNEPRVKPMPSLYAIIVSPQLLNAAYYDSYSHSFRDTEEYDKHLELVGLKELSAEEFGADSFQDDTHSVLIHGEKDGETVSKGHQLGITERDGFTPTTITTFDYNPKAGLGTSRLLNFDGRVETIDPNFVNRHHRSQRFRGEEVADTTQGQVVNITNVGDKVYVTIRFPDTDEYYGYEDVFVGDMEDVMLNDYTNSRGQEITFEALASGDIEMDRFTLREISESLTPEQKKDVEHWINLYGIDGALNQIEMMGWDVKPKPKEVEVVVEYTSDEDIHTIYDLLTNANLKVVSIAPVLNPEDFYAEEFEATKGIDTYSQPFEEMKIGSTTKKVATFIAAMIGGGAIYSHFTKRGE